MSDSPEPRPPLAEGEVILEIEGDLVSKPYTEITLQLMKTFGGEVEHSDYQSFQ